MTLQTVKTWGTSQQTWKSFLLGGNVYVYPALFHVANKDLELQRRPTAVTSSPRLPLLRRNTMTLKIKVNQMCFVTLSSATKGRRADNSRCTTVCANAMHTRLGEFPINAINVVLHRVWVNAKCKLTNERAAGSEEQPPLSIDTHCAPTPFYYDKRQEGWSEEQPGAVFVELMEMKQKWNRNETEMVCSIFRDMFSTADHHCPCFDVGHTWDCHSITFCVIS